MTDLLKLPDEIPNDPIALGNLFNELRILATQRPLTPEETVKMVTVTRLLRRTNTGPAQVKTPKTKKTKSKPSFSIDDLLT